MELPKPSRRNTTVGAYVLGEEIGKGAHGQVYKAIDTRDGSMVAVKEIALRRLDDKARRALRLEIQLLTELGAHENVIALRGVVEHDAYVYVVLELAENGSLASLVKPTKFGVCAEPLARVYVHDADLGDGGGGGEAGMPLDDFNDPYARKQAILRGLGLDAGGRAPEGYPNAQLVTVPVPRTRVEASLAVRGDRVSVELEYLAHGDMDAALAVHGAAYVRYLATAWDRWCRTPPENRCRFFRRPLPESASRAIHDRVGGWSAGVPALVPSNFVNRTFRNAQPGVGVHAETCWYHTDGDTPVFKGLAPSLAGDMRVVAAIVASMETELRRGLQNDENAYYYALMSHPGHHAGFSNAGGYCYLNNAAVLARALAASSLNATRVAILDVDYHAGNGTAALFYDDPDVLVCSIHADPNGDYPWNAGYAEDVGCGRGQGKTVNVPLPKGATWANGYEAALETLQVTCREQVLEVQRLEVACLVH